MIVETLPERAEPRAGMGIGGWILAGTAVFGMFGLITLFRRRSFQRKTAVVEFPQLDSELATVPLVRNW